MTLEKILKYVRISYVKQTESGTKRKRDTIKETEPDEERSYFHETTNVEE